MGKEIALVKSAEVALTDDQQHALQSAETLGALKAVAAVAKSFEATCSAQAFRALQHFAATKGYTAYGYERFDDFLNHCPQSPMTKNQYYDRLAVIDSEGDATFDALNALRVPVSKRKLLAAGGVKLDGDDLLIGEERFPVSDRQAVVSAVKALADTAAEQARVIDRGKKEIDNRKRQVADLKEKLSRGSFVSADATPHFRALVSLIGDYQLLAQEVAEIDDATEKQRFGALALDRLADAKLQFENALGFQAPESKLGLSEQDEDELLAVAD